MKLYHNTMIGLRYKHWNRSEAIAYFIKRVARELYIAPNFFLNRYAQTFKKRWLKRDDKQSYFDFGICKLPDISNSPEKLYSLIGIFEDTLMFPCFLNDDYHKEIVEYYDQIMSEGQYGYTDGLFDVTVKENDIVIDAGAWIGDFSAYAASKGQWFILSS